MDNGFKSRFDAPTVKGSLADDLVKKNSSQSIVQSPGVSGVVMAHCGLTAQQGMFLLECQRGLKSN